MQKADFLMTQLILQRLVESPEVRHERLFLVSVGGLIVNIYEAKNKGADQLRDHRAADLCLGFRICKMQVFL